MSLKNNLTKVDRRDAKLAMAHIYVAFIALLLGGLAGLLQVFVRSGQFTLPAGIGYYQVLTVHGVLLGLILTTFFIFGFQIASVSRTSGTFSNGQRRLGWIGFWLMTIGTAAAAVMVLLNEASVLYTFYAPLKAHWIFYLGLTLVVVGSFARRPLLHTTAANLRSRFFNCQTTGVLLGRELESHRTPVQLLLRHRARTSP